MPPAGGDTLFADARAAYEALSPGLRATLDGLRAINSSRKADASKTREDRIKDSPNVEKTRLYEAEHPIVRTHPETGRKALYCSVAHTIRFKDMTTDESAGLLLHELERAGSVYVIFVPAVAMRIEILLRVDEVEGRCQRRNDRRQRPFQLDHQLVFLRRLDGVWR